MITMHRANLFLRKIETVEVLKQTEKMVVIKSSFGDYTIREKKESKYYIYAETLEKARQSLIAHLNSEIAKKNKSIEHSQKKIKENQELIKKLKAGDK